MASRSEVRRRLLSLISSVSHNAGPSWPVIERKADDFLDALEEYIQERIEKENPDWELTDEQRQFLEEGRGD